MDVLIRGIDAIAMIALTLFAGCATSHRADPSKIGIMVEAPTTACVEGDADIPVVIRVRNESRGVLKIGVDGKTGPPFAISWLYYDVFSDPPRPDDWKHGPGGHGLMPPLSLRVDPGDSTIVFADLYALGPDDQGRKFRIRMEDEEGHTYATDAFLPCVEAKP